MGRGLVRPFKPDLILTVFLTLIWGCIIAVNPDSATAHSSSSIEPVPNKNNQPLEINNAIQPSISSDGRFIAFISKVANLDQGSHPEEYGIFIHDRLKNETIRLPVVFPFEISNITPVVSRISADGRFVAMGAWTGISPRTENESLSPYGIFLYDLFSGEMQPISIGSILWGSQDSPPVPNLSGDGRFTTSENFSKSPDPLGDQRGQDILIYDRIREYNYSLAIADHNKETLDLPPKLKISDDSRVVIWNAENYPNMIGTFNRVTSDNEIRDYSGSNKGGKVVDFDISADGNILAFIYQITGNNGEILQQVYLHNYLEDDTVLFTELEGVSTGISSLAISGNGNYLAIHYSSGNDGGYLNRYEIDSGNATLVDIGIIGPVFDYSYDGSVLVYTRDINDISQVFVWEKREPDVFTYILAGQVTDSTGHPLGLVTIRDDRGQSVRTDGEGRFWLNGIRPGLITLRADKEGYLFSPGEIQQEVDSDIKDLSFVYAHHEVLLEAKKDTGMPYSFNRGESGPFHGFSAGYCTDLILDAYTWGVDYNVQFALEQDYKVHPWHFYRWRDARNAHDMWRYFSYSGQIQPHSNPYQPGDIVFFDWSEDGEIDHVAIVSEVNSRNRPQMMYDASGVINANPRGLAAELPWEDFHEQTVRGFARWSGKYEPIIPNLPPGQMLQIALGGDGVDFRLIDAGGNLISADEFGISGGRYDNWVWEQSISIDNQFSIQDYYLVVVYNPSENPLPYQFTAQFIEDGLVTGRIENKGSLVPGEIKRFPLILDLDNKSAITLNLGNSNRGIQGLLYPIQ